MKKILLVCTLLSLSLGKAQMTNVYSYGFDAVFPADWTITNQSSPSGTGAWVKASYTSADTSQNSIFSSGIGGVPAGQSGGNNSFALVNYTSTTGTGTISNWLITPVINVKDGDIISFYSRKGTDGTTDYADRLELRYSTAATTVNPSGGSTGLGSFTNVAVTVNPNLATGFVYPKTWTQYQFTITGIGTTAIPVKFAFRYFVTSGGVNGTNSDIIGIDTFSVDRPTLSISEIDDKSKTIALYPNPTSDFINFKTDAKIIKTEVYDLAGKNVNLPLKDNQLDVRKLPAGQYLINIETAEGKTTEKFIKK
ncbi:T9SS-dependent choice-of-anchor J family protein [Chryseobacterium foetidum]|uniref:T9SS-dependent choice-of-anchor J family protein n=1 Tax=Chryseobacterium foetidum TaxID=2951057 RepID=UPI0021C6D790|nr:T9SS type A sorting domain-containing protein [Chryseobacterium foetidum]